MNKFQSQINQRTRKYFRDRIILDKFFLTNSKTDSYYSKRKFFRKFYKNFSINPSLRKVKLNSIYGI